MNLNDRKSRLDRFYNRPADKQPNGFLVRFFGGPLDGMAGWTEQVASALAVPVNPEIIDNPVMISPSLASQLPATSVNLYRLRKQNGGLVYVFDGASRPADR